MREQMMHLASPVLDLKVRKVGLQSLGQCLGLVAAYSRRAQWVPSDVRPSESLGIDQDNATDAGLRQRTGDRRAH